MCNLFAIDIGNTNISVGLVKNHKILSSHYFSICDFKKKNFNFFLNPFLPQIKKMNYKNFDVYVSSVVPEINKHFKINCQKLFKKKIVFISDKKIKLDIKIDLKKKGDVGLDRLLNAIAVKNLYKHPAIVIDFGTATTFDIINKYGSYSGGLISPGINLSLESLFMKTSKLPLVKFKKNNFSVGKSTVSAIENGLYWGYVGMTSYLINKIKKNYNYNFFCVSTGGYAKMISNDIKEINKIDQNLTLNGIIEVYKINNG